MIPVKFNVPEEIISPRSSFAKKMDAKIFEFHFIPKKNDRVDFKSFFDKEELTELSMIIWLKKQPQNEFYISTIIHSKDHVLIELGFSNCNLFTYYEHN